MTRNEFVAACEAALIAPAVALESEAIREALAARDDSEVRRLLREEI